MQALIVGGDDIGALRQEMTLFGVERVDHWSGRKQDCKSLPGGTDVLVILWYCVSQGQVARLKRQAPGQGTPVFLCRRSTIDARRLIGEYLRGVKSDGGARNVASDCRQGKEHREAQTQELGPFSYLNA